MDNLLGNLVVDSVTGFVGTAVSRTEYLDKTTSYGVQNHTIKDGVLADLAYFDEKRLTVLDDAVPVKT